MNIQDCICALHKAVRLHSSTNARLWSFM